MAKLRNTGFTLTELVVVLVLIGVLAVTAIPRFMGRGAFESSGFTDQVVAATQYARQQAVAQRRQVCVNFSIGGLTVTRAEVFGGACSADLANPGGGSNYVAPAPTGVTMAAVAPAALPLTIIFDPAGGFAGPTLTLNVVGDVTRAVVVEAGTGHVHSP
jgi:MSHA pilin protein MshC